MSFVIQFEGIVGPVLSPESPLPEQGEYLAHYDPNAHDGQGWAVWSSDPRDAITFCTIKAALDCWMQQSTCLPWRADGLPNRPLTGSSVSVAFRPDPPAPS